MTEEELPHGWAWSTLDEIAEINPRTEISALADDVEISFVPMASVEEATGRLDPTQTRRHSDLKRKSLTRFQEGDLLFAKITPCMENGKIASASRLIGGFGFGSTEFHVIRSTSGISARYLLRYLLQDSVRIEAERNMAGAVGQRRVPTRYLRELKVPVPPLAEQKRIVDVVEDHLSRLDAAAEGLLLSSRRIPALRGSVRGRIARLGDPSAQLPDGWRWGVLADVLERVQAGKSFLCESRPATEGEWGVIKVSAMTWGEFRPNENKAVLPGRDIDKRNEIRSGDILVSRANTSEYVGAPVMVRDCPANLLLSDKSLRLIPKPGIDREWLLQVLSSPYVRRQISDKATGTKDSMRNISQKSLEQVRIAIPPSDSMEAIGMDVDTALSQIQGLNDSLSRSITRAANLRQGILRQAFAGKLVPQEPSDEPASALLERIRAERATQAKPKRGRPPKKASALTTRPAPSVSSEPAGMFVQEELGL